MDTRRRRDALLLLATAGTGGPPGSFRVALRRVRVEIGRRRTAGPSPVRPMSTARIPFLDVAAAYAELKDELDAAARRVMASGQFILGPR